MLPGTLPAGELTRRLRDTDAAAILKLGRTYPAVRQALRDSAASTRRTTSSAPAPTGERILTADAVADDEVPYFAIAVVPAGRAHDRLRARWSSSAWVPARRTGPRPR